MTYTVLVGIALIATVLVLWKPDYLLMILATGAWILLWWYYPNNPIDTIPASSFGNDVIMLTLGVATFMIPIITFMRIKGMNTDKRNNYIKELQKENKGQYFKPDGSRKEVSDLTTSEYRELIHRKLHKR
jgi:hypothetical protein